MGIVLSVLAGVDIYIYIYIYNFFFFFLGFRLFIGLSFTYCIFSFTFDILYNYLYIVSAVSGRRKMEADYPLVVHIRQKATVDGGYIKQLEKKYLVLVFVHPSVYPFKVTPPKFLGGTKMKGGFHPNHLN